MRELSVAEQRHRAVQAVLFDGGTVTDVAAAFGASRQSVHTWLARYEVGGLDGLADRSSRPRSSPVRMPAHVEAVVIGLRTDHRTWGARRIVHELGSRALVAARDLPKESGVYRALRRAGLIEAGARRRRKETWKRWERARPMELWQMDLVGGFALSDGTSAKALTGVDDHSRYCISARLMLRERTRPVCEGLAAAMRAHGVPGQVLTDNGRVFTGRFNAPPVEVLFDRICQENGAEHLLTAPRSPTTTGKIERFHRSLRAEFLTGQAVFTSLRAAQGALDEWVRFYNTERPHQGIAMATPKDRFFTRPVADQGRPPGEPVVDLSALAETRTGEDWVPRRVASNGVVSVSWQQVSVGKHHAVARAEVHVCDRLLQLWVGLELVKTVPRRSIGEVRKKRASTRTTNNQLGVSTRTRSKSVKNVPKVDRGTTPGI